MISGFLLQLGGTDYIIFTLIIFDLFGIIYSGNNYNGVITV